MKGRDAALVVALWGALNLVLAALMLAFTTDVMSHAAYWPAVLLTFALVRREQRAGHAAQRVYGGRARAGAATLTVGRPVARAAPGAERGRAHGVDGERHVRDRGGDRQRHRG